jgi:hypothetical protein
MRQMHDLTNCNLSRTIAIKCGMTIDEISGCSIEVGRRIKMKNSNLLKLIFALCAALAIVCVPAPAFAQHGGGGHGGGGGGGSHGGGGGGGFTAEAAEAGVTLISVVADVLPGVLEERHRARFQGRALVGIAPTARGRTE